jgi:hypothetical protein
MYWSVSNAHQIELQQGLTTPPVQDEVFTTGDFVYIKAGNDTARGALLSSWIGKVLEIRAGDAAHVWVRIYWMYRPEDLPAGRQPYHGEGELIASNHMDVIEAQTVHCKTPVLHLDEEGDADPEEELFWRQTYDVIGGKGVSVRLSACTARAMLMKEQRLPKYCIDQAPHNPDEHLIQCEQCGIWLHQHCLEEAAVRKAYDSNDLEYPDKIAPARGHPPKASSRKPMFSASLSTKEKPRIIVTDLRRGKGKQTWEEPVQCLECYTTINLLVSTKHRATDGDEEVDGDSQIGDDEALERDADSEPESEQHDAEPQPEYLNTPKPTSTSPNSTTSSSSSQNPPTSPPSAQAANTPKPAAPNNTKPIPTSEPSTLS